MADLTASTGARFAAGERSAFEEVYAAHAGVVRGWVRRFFTSPFEREEAVQEVWLHVSRSAGAYEVNRGPLRPWLRVLTANRCRELLRARGAGREVPLGDESEAWLDGAPSPEAATQRTKLREALTAFANKLPPDESEVLRLGWLDELPLEEIAKRLNRSHRQVKYLRLKVVTRASEDATLRALLAEAEP
ncbi:MAG: sigma-70 family RNA polymerase sigma factor [Archangium sp.]